MHRPLLSITLAFLVTAASLLHAQPGVSIDHKTPVSCLAWSPNGQWLATGAQDFAPLLRAVLDAHLGSGE